MYWSIGLVNNATLRDRQKRIEIEAETDSIAPLRPLRPMVNDLRRDRLRLVVRLRLFRVCGCGADSGVRGGFPPRPRLPLLPVERPRQMRPHLHHRDGSVQGGTRQGMIDGWLRF